MATRAKRAPAAATRKTASNPVTPIALDSSCWIEFFADSERADLFAATVDAVEQLIVPVLTICEVTKKLAREAGGDVAASALSLMQRGHVIDIDLALAVAAAGNGLPMAHSLIYETARRHGATLWTQDAHFDGLPGVNYFRRERSAA